MNSTKKLVKCFFNFLICLLKTTQPPSPPTAVSPKSKTPLSNMALPACSTNTSKVPGVSRRSNSSLRIKNQDVAFSLPVHWRKFQRVLELQQVRRWDEEEYVYRVAWRNIRDWVFAQLALYETEIVEMPQVFLPFATDAKGQTL